MGIGLYLESVGNLIIRPYLDPSCEDDLDSKAVAEDLSPATFNELRRHGAIFRDKDIPEDVMSAMGLSWKKEVEAILDLNGRLPVTCARGLATKIGRRPLSKQRLARRYHENMRIWNKHRLVVDGKLPMIILPPHIISFAEFLLMRRNELLSILGLSVDFGEPLVCLS